MINFNKEFKKHRSFTKYSAQKIVSKLKDRHGFTKIRVWDIYTEQGSLVILGVNDGWFSDWQQFVCVISDESGLSNICKDDKIEVRGNFSSYSYDGSRSIYLYDCKVIL